MRPWCDRPLCTRQMAHQHPKDAPEAPDSPTGASVAPETPVPVPVLHQNGSGAEDRSAEEAGKDLVARARELQKGDRVHIEMPDGEQRDLLITSTTPDTEVKGAAASEVVADVAAEDSPWLPRWEAIAAEIEASEKRLSSARARRRELFGEMAADVGLAGVGEVTGLTRQRVGQILSKS